MDRLDEEQQLEDATFQARKRAEAGILIAEKQGWRAEEQRLRMEIMQIEQESRKADALRTQRQEERVVGAEGAPRIQREQRRRAEPGAGQRRPQIPQSEESRRTEPRRMQQEEGRGTGVEGPSRIDRERRPRPEPATGPRRPLVPQEQRARAAAAPRPLQRQGEGKFRARAGSRSWFPQTRQGQRPRPGAGTGPLQTRQERRPGGEAGVGPSRIRQEERSRSGVGAGPRLVARDCESRSILQFGERTVPDILGGLAKDPGSSQIPQESPRARLQLEEPITDTLLWLQQDQVAGGGGDLLQQESERRANPKAMLEELPGPRAPLTAQQQREPWLSEERVQAAQARLQELKERRKAEGVARWKRGQERRL
jgi:hypothetical protein